LKTKLIKKYRSQAISCIFVLIFKVPPRDLICSSILLILAKPRSWLILQVLARSSCKVLLLDLAKTTVLQPSYTIYDSSSVYVYINRLMRPSSRGLNLAELLIKVQSEMCWKLKFLTLKRLFVQSNKDSLL
jgi:hypothetical protein